MNTPSRKQFMELVACFNLATEATKETLASEYDQRTQQDAEQSRARRKPGGRVLMMANRLDLIHTQNVKLSVPLFSWGVRIHNQGGSRLFSRSIRGIQPRELPACLRSFCIVECAGKAQRRRRFEILRTDEL